MLLYYIHVLRKAAADADAAEAAGSADPLGSAHARLEDARAAQLPVGEAGPRLTAENLRALEEEAERARAGLAATLTQLAAARGSRAGVFLQIR